MRRVVHGAKRCLQVRDGRLGVVVDHRGFVGGVDTLASVVFEAVAQERRVKRLAGVSDVVRQDAGSAHEFVELSGLQRLNHRIEELPDAEPDAVGRLLTLRPRLKGGRSANSRRLTPLAFQA